MKKIKVTEKSGAFIEYINEGEVLNRLHLMGHGQPECWVPHKDEGGSYDDADVLDERLHEILPEVMQKQVKLKAEYTVEITDISAEHALEECISKRKSEYPSAEEFLNAFFDGGEQALAELQAKRLAVKAKYPKP
jgi:hypothetical protein